MLLFFFFNDTATTEIYTLSLHDALPISSGTKIVTDRVSPARVRHLPQVAPRRNLPAGLGRPRGLRRGSAYGSFPAVHQPRRNLSLWRGILLFAASLSRFGF